METQKKKKALLETTPMRIRKQHVANVWPVVALYVFVIGFWVE